MANEFKVYPLVNFPAGFYINRETHLVVQIDNSGSEIAIGIYENGYIIPLSEEEKKMALNIGIRTTL